MARYTKTWRCWRLLALLLLALALLAAPPLGAATTVQRSVSAGPTGRVDVHLFDGSVRIEAWERAEVQVVASFERAADQLELKSSGSAVSIEISSRNPGRSRANLVVQVPRASNLYIEVLSAAVEVKGLVGDLEVEAVNGSIVIAGGPRRVEAQSVSGSIELESTGSESLELETVSGSLRAVAVAARVTANTVAGPMRLRLSGLESGKFETVSGRIEAVIVPEQHARVELQSFSGSTRLEVPAKLSARYQLESTTGRMRVELPGARRQEAGRDADDDRVTFEQGSGDAAFRLETFSGEIEVRPIADPS